jgi:type IV pilus assembly protein PilF
MMRKNLWPFLIFFLCTGVLMGCATTQPVDGKKKAEAKHQLGNSLLYEKNYQGAVTELREAAELEPDNPNIQNSLGLAYQGLRLPERAIPHYQKAIQLKPDFPEFENNLGTAYAAVQQWDKAIQWFQRAADNFLYRTRYLAYDNLGSAYHNKGDYRRAIENFKKSVEYSKDYTPAYINMGTSYEALREWDNAIAAYKKAAEIEPDLALPHLLLGGLYLRLNRQEAAVDSLLIAIRNDPNGPYGKAARSLLATTRKTQ